MDMLTQRQIDLGKKFKDGRALEYFKSDSDLINRD